VLVNYFLKKVWKSTHIRGVLEHLLLFKGVRKVAKNDFCFAMSRSICPPACMEQLGSYWTYFHEIWYWIFFNNLAK